MDFNNIFSNARIASRKLALIKNEEINDILIGVADAAINETPYIISENKKDLAKIDSTNPKYDRLKLTENRLENIAKDIKEVTKLPSPTGKILKDYMRPNGLHIRKISVPFGVIGFIYEARPNVSFDVFSLCLKSGNACILKGGSDADCTNKAIVNIIHQVLSTRNISQNIVSLLPPGHESTNALLNAIGYVDLIIPRGSKTLIELTRKNASIPVIETGAGICHTYFDQYGDLLKGKAIINNAKTRRVSVCNALDCAIIHQSRLKDLPFLCAPLIISNVIIYADEPAYKILLETYPKELLKRASENSFGTEFLDYKMSIKTVNSINEALEHIEKYGSMHSESIVTENETNANIFLKEVDAACVYVNAPTSFTDGAQFGLGAEIGISTQKLHARGPMGLEEMTTYKWIIEGNGQIRNK